MATNGSNTDVAIRDERGHYLKGMPGGPSWQPQQAHRGFLLRPARRLAGHGARRASTFARKSSNSFRASGPDCSSSFCKIFSFERASWNSPGRPTSTRRTSIVLATMARNASGRSAMTGLSLEREQKAEWIGHRRKLR